MSENQRTTIQQTIGGILHDNDLTNVEIVVALEIDDNLDLATRNAYGILLATTSADSDTPNRLKSNLFFDIDSARVLRDRITEAIDRSERINGRED